MMYIQFYHGRDLMGQKMEDWGKEGPVVGPLNIQWTYGHVKFFEGYTMHHLKVVEDLIPIGDKFYGDFVVLEEDDDYVLLLREEMINGEILTLEEFVELNKYEKV